MWVVGDSPVVPLTTRPSAPSATSCFASFCAASKSTEPSAFMGVTMAGRIRPKGAGSRRCIVPSVIVPTVLPATDAEAPEFATISQYELPSRDQNPPPAGTILPSPSLPESRNLQSLEQIGTLNNPSHSQNLHPLEQSSRQPASQRPKTSR